MELPERALCQERLNQVFPEFLPDRTALTSPIATAAVFVALYAEAIDGDRMIRPSTVLWMCDGIALRREPEERSAWYEATLGGNPKVRELCAQWQVDFVPWYRDNSREPLRDETFRGWARYGALIEDVSIPTTSPRPRWSLAPDFAGLFDPAVQGEALAALLAQWHIDHLGLSGRARSAVARQMAQRGSHVVVSLPDGSSRSLASGESSMILQGVIEQLAPRLLGHFGVVFISESRDHVHVGDAAFLHQVGMTLKADRLLPDALLFEFETSQFWFVEVVATGGPIDEGRRQKLLDWATDQGIATTTCRFITAFRSRASAAYRRVSAVLATGTLAWFLDEPDLLLRLDLLA